MWEIKGKDNQVKATVGSLEYNGEWMGESYVTVTIESPAPVNFEIGDYIIYRDERFEINYDPGKIKSAPRYEKGDAFKYENIKFNSLADELTRCDFRDVVLQDNNLHFTSLPKFPFYGGVKDLANRIQANLDKLYTGANKWSVVVSPEFQGGKELNVQVDNIKVQGALEILVNQFETYYTITGRTITIGAAGIPAGHLFKYGKGNGLYEIEQNAEADQAIVTRLRAYGSTRNLPHRYYNSLSGADGKKLIPDNMAVQYLMLPEFPYTTQDPYIDSPNIAKLGIREGTVFFDGSGELEEIYPSIEGMTAEQLKDAGVPCSSTGALDEIVSAEQMTDNGVGEINEGETQTTAKPPTFKVSLKDLGFDINDHLTTETATLSFKTGMLGGRNFEIVKNGCKPIKDASGKVTGYELELNRVYDDGIKLWFPYSAYNAHAGDKFVLLYIEMPEVYIKAAAQRLKEAATEWLSKNDYSRSIYAPKVDEIFMARQHDLAMASGGKIKSLHDTLKEGMLLLFEDEDLNIDASIFIDRLTIKEEGAVPTYEVVLKEEKTVGRLDKMQNQIDSLVAGKGQGGGGYTASQIRSMIDAYGGTRFLSKIKDDRTAYKVSTDKAFEVGKYLAGVSGGIMGMDADGDSFAEVARLYVRVKAFFEELTVIKAGVLAGKHYITPGGGIKCTKVDDTGSAWRCWFLSGQDGEQTECKFEAGDQAISEMFNAKAGTTNKVSNHRYWRLVTAVENGAYTDDSGNRYGYIDLSKTDCEADSDTPQAGDEICQLGNRLQKDRQTAMVFSTVDADAPSVKLFGGISNFSLDGKAVVSFGRDPITGQVYFRLGSSGAKQYLEYMQGVGLLVAGAISSKSTYDDGSGTRIPLGEAIGGAIRDTDVLYISHTSATEAPGLPVLGSDGTVTDARGWQTTAPEWVRGRYIWQVTYTRKGDGTATFKGLSCLPGQDAVTQTGETVEYAVATQGNTPPATGWQQSSPAVAKGQYRWTRVTTLYSDGTSAVAYSVTYIATDGVDGASYTPNLLKNTEAPRILTAGTNIFSFFVYEFDEPLAIAGGDKISVTVEDIEVLAGSPVGFTVGLYDHTTAKWYGSKENITKSNPRCTLEVSNGLSFNTAKTIIIYAGVSGATSGNSVKLGRVMAVRGGTPMPWSPAASEMKGVTIASESVKYAKTTSTTQPADSAFTADSIGALGTIKGGDYIWSRKAVTYTDGTVTKEYAVSRIGADGETSVAGLHVAYASGITGSLPHPTAVTDFSTTMFDGARYIGICKDDKVEDPGASEFGKYDWARFVGEDAAPAKLVVVNADATAFTYKDGFATLTGVSQIKLTANVQGIDNPTYQWSYRRGDNESGAFTSINGATSATYALTHNASIWDISNSLTLRCTVGGVHDEVTIYKVSSGTNGSSTIAFQTTYNVPLSQWESWLGATNEYNGWYVDALHGAKVGDTAIIQARIRDIGTDCYFIGTITRIDSSTRICVRTPLPLYYGKPGADGTSYTPNLLKNTRAPRTETASTDTSYIIYEFDSPLEVKAGDKFTVSVGSIDVLAGTPSEFTAFLYNTDGKTPWGSRLALTREKPYVTLTADKAITAKTMLLYVGKYGETAGNTVKYAEVMLVRGEAPAPWSPAASEMIGQDAYTVILGNEAHLFEGDTEAAIGGYTDCSVIVYKGATRVAATIGTPTEGLVQGITASNITNPTATADGNIRINIAAGTKQRQGAVVIPVTVDGNVITKKFSWALSLEGTGYTENLLLNSAFKNGLSLWGAWGSPAVREVVTQGNRKWLHIKSTTASYQGVSQLVTLTPGTYTLSALVRGAAAGQSFCFGVHFRNSSGGIASQDWYYWNVGTTEQRVSWKFTVPSGITEINLMAGRGNNTSAVTEFYYTELKLETGENDNPVWSPNPAEQVAPKIKEQYALHDSDSGAPTTGWSYIKQPWVAGKYYWTRTEITYGDGTVEYTTPVCATGAAGTDAFRLDLSNEMVPVSCYADGTVAVSGTIATSKATVYKGGVADTGWTFTKVDSGCTSSINSSTEIVTVSDISADTATVTVTARKSGQADQTAVMNIWKVKPGAGYTNNLLTGTKEFSGYSQLTLWTKEAETRNGNAVYSRTAAWEGAYRPFAVKAGETYTFSADVKVSGKPNAILYVHDPIGTNVVPGASQTFSLADGVWKRLSITFTPNADGTIKPRVESGTATGKLYISSYKLESGTNPTPVWTPNAEDLEAKSVTVNADAQIFSYENGFATLVGASTINLSATLQGTTGYQWSYRRGDNESGSFTNISGATTATYALTHNASIWGTAKSITLRCTSGGAYDEVTIAKVSSGTNGAKGDKGNTGAAGADAYTVLLTNESHTFAGGVSSAVAGDTTCEVLAYKGATKIPATINSITGQVAGLTTEIANPAGTSTISKFTVRAATTLTARQGVLKINLTIDGKPFVKEFSWSLALKGSTGDPATVYQLGLSANAIVRNLTGGLSPSTITVTKYKIMGDSRATTTEKCVHYQALDGTGKVQTSGTLATPGSSSSTVSTANLASIIRSDTVSVVLTLRDTASTSSAFHDSESVPVGDETPVVGGGNVLLNSGFRSKSHWYWGWSNNAFIDTTPAMLHEGQNPVKLSANDLSDNKFYGIQQNGTTTGNEALLVNGRRVLTASVWTYCTDRASLDQGAKLEVFFQDEKGERLSGSRSVSIVPTANNTWQRFSLVVPVSSTTTAENPYSAVFSAHVVRNGTIWLACPQVEWGSVLTEWAPSPLDNDYLSQALRSAMAEYGKMDGGLILATLLRMGFTNAEGIYRVMSGISGIADREDAPAVWGGGDMYDAAKPDTIPSGEEAADFMLRHNGTAYFCSNLIRFLSGRMELGDHIIVDTEGLKLLDANGDVSLMVANKTVGNDLAQVAVSNRHNVSLSGTFSVRIAYIAAVTDPSTGMATQAYNYFAADTTHTYTLGTSEMQAGSALTGEARLSFTFSSNAPLYGGGVTAELLCGTEVVRTLTAAFGAPTSAGKRTAVIRISETSLPKTGKYSLRVKVSRYTSGGSLSSGTAYTVSPESTLVYTVGAKSGTRAGNDGFLALRNGAALLVRDNYAGMLVGANGIRCVTGFQGYTGLQMTNDGGNTWKTFNFSKALSLGLLS